MACCDWATFEDGFLGAWRRKRAGELLIDWARAKRDWRRFHCTGAEAAAMQLRDLSNEAEYLWIEPRRPNDDGNGRGPKDPAPVPRTPLPAGA